MIDQQYTICLDYVDKQWSDLTCSVLRDKDTHVKLPNKFISPNNTIFKNDQFYWDSYFIIKGLLTANKVQLARGMVDNLVYLFKRFRIVPSRNRYHNTGRSQPPFLTSMILDVFARTHDKKWLKRVVKVAEEELQTYWMDNNEGRKHLVFSGLSRYCDHHINHITAEHESGWDMTSRFFEHCLDYLPIDLNCCLYKYETDLAVIYQLLGDGQKANSYILKAARRKETINKLMWNERKGFFFDYNYVKKKQSKFYSLAGFYPLWSKLVTPAQAERMRDNLKRFEYVGGLANTQRRGLSKIYKQWDYPNGWPNMQWTVIIGLHNYGFVEDAERLTKKWLDLCTNVFSTTGKIWEKYDVVNRDLGKSGRYATQEGFAWTDAVFLLLTSLVYKKQ